MTGQRDTAMMEALNRAYVRAVATRAGCRYEDKGPPDIGTDAQIEYLEWDERGAQFDTGIQLRLQLKATSVEERHTQEHIVYDLEVDHYRKLIRPSPQTKIILVVYNMPRDEALWLQSSDSQLALRSCAYWKSLEGERDTANTSNVRVKIPRSQRFDVDAVKGALREIALRGDPSRSRRRRARALPSVGGGASS